MGHLFDNLFRKGVINNSVKKVAHLLRITQTLSVLVPMMRLVCSIYFVVRGGRLAFNIANVGAFSKMSHKG